MKSAPSLLSLLWSSEDMDDTHNDGGLPLPDLYIENFRGIRNC